MNRLASAKSLYLRQHARNPVDWHPWGEEAFARAASEDKPVFLSIGYSSCHWCHVMERESFEDAEVAALLNASYVAVKVDREERPDLDHHYMAVCQMMTGSGGWPLTVVLAPDKRPFFAGTYFPKTRRFGRAGLIDILPRLSEAWRSRRDEVLRAAGEISRAASSEPGPESGSLAELDPGLLKVAVGHFARAFDPKHGGFGEAPKFPSPHNLLFLFRAWKRTGDERTLRMAEQTLVRMRRGGIFDHLGLGFHRYSTDARWLVPHFEKMLYDQGMLLLAYAEAARATGNDLFRRTAREIAAYVLRDMTSPEGAYYAAEDADAEGEEGAFYLWTEDEVRRALPPEDAELAVPYFGLKKAGNFDDHERPGSGRNVLYEALSPEEIAVAAGIPEGDAARRLAAIRATLFRVREGRARPLKDTKILADWNGLVIAGLAKAAGAADDPALAAAAGRAADFVLGRMRTAGGALLHMFAEGEVARPAFLDDYAFFVWGLIELYEATFEAGRLAAALELARRAVDRFRDAKHGGFFFTAEGESEFAERRKESYDGANPSGNAVMTLDLLRLARMTGEAELDEIARRALEAFSARIAGAPTAHAHWLSAVDFALGPGREIVIVGRPGAADTNAFLDAARSSYDPNTVILLRPAGKAGAEIARLAPFVKGMKPIDGRAAAYVCTNFSCLAPITDSDKIR